jgi:isopenicillin N synthase-like dioxygenase
MTTQDLIEQLDDSLAAKRVAFDSIPVVDLSPLTEGEKGPKLEQMAKDIHWALANTGFMYVKNHGVDQDLIDNAFEEGAKFFDLPLDEKMNLHISQSGDSLRGYTEAFGENTDPARTKDLKEVFDLGREASDGKIKPFFGPNNWPTSMPSFGNTMTDYHNQVMAMARRLMGGIALSLGLDQDYFETMMKEPVSIQRVLHYPPQDKIKDDSLIGIGAHSDYGCLTILAQDNVGGLQIMNRDGDWIKAPPIPGTFVINIGDMMQRLTNDVYLANLHRVINASGRERYSMPFFFDVDFETIFKPLEKFVNAENPSKYEPIVCGEHKWNRYLDSFAHLKATAAE